MASMAGMFLEVLEPYILKDMLGSLPPEVSNIKGLLMLTQKSSNEYTFPPI
jgi:hypothetical protein